ncbi:hypothetical protein FQV39_28845 [Bosea sp. F3-2]|uniref:hypothetical protein n=1 Tax=Bosea sp. F3-2 TaxID=2599640 RepID=UPI0011EFF5B0|nr:hypothetical protein [Bosea sp. F3-2]QEL26172.1 hypothetical protein FQV39_28845 [Bosea sp. F3-2]
MKPELTLRRTYNDHPRPEDDDRFWSVIHKGLTVGCINQTHGASDQAPYWTWVIHVHAGQHANGVRQVTATDGHAETRDAAMPAFRKAFERFLTYVGEEGWAAHVEHMARIGRSARG